MEKVVLGNKKKLFPLQGVAKLKNLRKGGTDLQTEIDSKGSRNVHKCESDYRLLIYYRSVTDVPSTVYIPKPLPYLIENEYQAPFHSQFSYVTITMQGRGYTGEWRGFMQPLLRVR